jgi:hypothetical protein
VNGVDALKRSVGLIQEPDGGDPFYAEDRGESEVRQRVFDGFRMRAGLNIVGS